MMMIKMKISNYADDDYGWVNYHIISHLHSTSPLSSSSSKYLCSTICCGDTFSSFGESFLANSEALPEPTGAADDRKW